VIPKNSAAVERITAVISNSFLFSALDKEQVGAVVSSMEERKVKPGETVIKQGAEGDNFYIIESGTFDVFKTINGQEKKVFFYDNKGSFGELALMYNTPRAATVVATSEGSLWVVDRATFRGIIIAATRKHVAMFEEFLGKVKLFEKLTSSERSMIADCLVGREYNDGEVVIQKGERGDSFYIVEKGIAEAIQLLDGKEVVVGTMKQGDYFGERALITLEPRAATVRAKGQLKVAMMARDAFERLLGDCREVMSRVITSYRSAADIVADRQ